MKRRTGTVPWPLAPLLVVIACQPPALAAGTAQPRSEIDARDVPVVDAAPRASRGDPQLRRLIASMLSASPELLSASSRALAAEERRRGAGLLPDPHLRYRHFVSPPETRVGPQQLGVEISQPIPWPGKREAERERAVHLERGAALARQDLERSSIRRLRTLYFEAAYLQLSLELNANERALLERVEHAALRRYETGRGIQQGVLRVQTALSTLESRRRELTRELASVSRRITRLAGLERQGLELEPIDLGPPPEPLLARLARSRQDPEHPRVRAARSRLDATLALSARRRIDTRPDLRVGLGYTRVRPRQDLGIGARRPEDDGQDIVALTLSLEVPVQRSRIAAGIAAADADASTARHELRAVSDDLRLELEDALDGLATARELLDLHRRTILPQARQSLASAEAAYATGDIDVLEVLDAERVLIRTRLEIAKHLRDLWTAIARVEYVVAPELTSGDQSS